MNFKDFLQTNIVILDGGMGTMLSESGLAPGERPEEWNLLHPDVIRNIQRGYFDAGANVVNTNTFGANRLKYERTALESVIKSAIDIAKQAKAESHGEQEKFISLDIGPTGKLLAPLGDLDFEEAVSIFSEVVRLGVKYGVDLITVETMNDSYETKAALLAVKESSSLPVIVTNSYGTDGKLMTGATPAAMVALLEGMGADAIGANCLDPCSLSKVASELLEVSETPIVVKPNAGIPKLIEGKTVFELAPSHFADAVLPLISKGVRAVGGCCGTTPEHIRLLADAAKGYTPKEIPRKNISAISSYTHAVTLGHSPVLIGERINPTGKPKLKEALRCGNMSYILTEGISEADEGAHVLDVNVGLPDINERELLSRVTRELQAVVDTPLQIDSSDPDAMEAALRIYNGKALINSVSGKRDSMESIFPLAKKYGGVIIALTLDEKGIPDTAEGRVAIARRILAEAEKHGISKKDIVFDPLTLTISTDTRAALTTLRAVELITSELGCHTSLGVSNVSFGLPERDTVNSAFFTLALSKGLSAAIMNPHSESMMKAYRAYKALSELDAGCAEYILSARSSAEEKENPKTASAPSLGTAVERGLSERAAELTRELLLSREPLDIINTELIPALDRVGTGFENKTVYLPELLMSAEAAGAAFNVIKSSKMQKANAKKVKILIATVKGDIHDIGKNIVKLLLENYGFTVYDLGRDVPEKTVVEKAKELSVHIVGLSALMTTTAPAMEKTAQILAKELPGVRIMVGGAVITEEYASNIGAVYAKDAMGAVRYAENVENELFGK